MAFQPKNPPGPIGAAVAENVALLRQRLNLNYADLSRRLDAIGRPIPILGLTRIEKGERRVDADDLVGLAVALEVAPVTLLMPWADAAESHVISTGFDSPIRAINLWDWLRAEGPIDGIPASKPEEETTERVRVLRQGLLKFYGGNSIPPWAAAQKADLLSMLAKFGEQLRLWGVTNGDN